MAGNVARRGKAYLKNADQKRSVELEWPPPEQYSALLCLQLARPPKRPLGRVLSESGGRTVR